MKQLNRPSPASYTITLTVFLKESVKFKDHKGRIVDIEVRGERDEDECFFRVKDVARCFNDIRCQDHMLDVKSGYNKQDHFLFFYRPRGSGTLESSRDKDKELFLTHPARTRQYQITDA
jgi:hypothetical protein